MPVMTEFDQLSAVIRQRNAVSELLRRERESRVIALECMETFHAPTEADRITADLAYQWWKDDGGPQAANDERAMALQLKQPRENF